MFLFFLITGNNRCEIFFCMSRARRPPSIITAIVKWEPNNVILDDAGKEHSSSRCCQVYSDLLNALLSRCNEQICGGKAEEFVKTVVVANTRTYVL